MFAFPKLVLLILIIAAVWIGYRWLDGVARPLPRRPQPPRRRAIDGVDLSRCGVCGAFVAASAAGCDRPDCPQPR
jgi:hypothetical protein